MEVSIRTMTIEDATAVAMLSSQLGYPLPVDQISTNIKAVLSGTDRSAFVAECDGKIVGWIGCSQAIMIEVAPHCEINGLVIDNDMHGKGIGRKLIERVKVWAREKGNDKLSLRCNVKRSEAHKFYLHLGFRDIKKQTNFVLDI